MNRVASHKEGLSHFAETWIEMYNSDNIKYGFKPAVSAEHKIATFIRDGDKVQL